MDSASACCGSLTKQQLQVRGSIAEDPLVVIPDCIVGIDESKQLKDPNTNEAFGGEIWSDFVCRLSDIRNCIDSGKFIVWTILRLQHGVHQRRSPENLEKFIAFVRQLPVLAETPLDFDDDATLWPSGTGPIATVLTPDACGVGGKSN